MTTILSVLDLGRGGLAAQSAAISVTSENINGVNTPGHVRRIARLETFLRTQAAATGVNYAATERAFDRFAFRKDVAELGHRGAASHCRNRGGPARWSWLTALPVAA